MQVEALGSTYPRGSETYSTHFSVQIMLGVDRLDMIKGIPQKLLAFEKFLEEHAEWRDKVLLVQIAVPTRGDVPEYQVSLYQWSSESLTQCQYCMYPRL